ncbi:MAG: hypothetical protein HUJ62_09870 [Streptococcus gallolyticus]|nr:hypothetical protein [Streptococcus gallolyticus]
MSKTKSLGINMIWNTFGSIFYLFCNWLITVLIVSLFNDYAASGVIAISMAVGNICSSIVMFKTRTVQISDNKNQFSDSDFIFSKIFTSLFSIVFCILYSLFTVSIENFTPVLIYILFKTVEGVIDVFHGIDQNANRFDIIGLSFIFRGLLIIVGFVCIYYLTHSIDLCFVVMTMAQLLILVIFDVPFSYKLGKYKLKFDIHRIFSLLKLCFPAFLSVIVMTAVVSLARQLFGIMYSDVELGIYAAIATPSVIVQASFVFIYFPLLGPLSQYWDSGEISKFKQLLIKLTIIITAIVLVTVAVFLLFGTELLSLVFNPELASYSYLLTLIILCTAATAIFVFLQDLFISIRLIKHTIISSVISLVCALVIYQYMFNVFYMNGISITILIAYLIAVIYLIIVLGKATSSRALMYNKKKLKD